MAHNASSQPPLVAKRLRVWLAPAIASLMIAGPVTAAPRAPAALPLSAAEAVLPEDAWWRRFGDPTLTSLVEGALANSPNARLAIARLHEARAVRAEGLARVGVQGDLGVQASRVEAKGTGIYRGRNGLTDVPLAADSVRYAEAALPLEWEVDLLGRRRLAKGALAADFRSETYLYKASRLRLAADVADQLFLVRGLRQALSDALAVAQVDRELSDLALQAFGAGLIESTEVARLDAQGADSGEQAASLASRLDVAAAELQALIGSDIDARPAMVAPIAAAPPVPTAVPANLLARRPDVQAAAQDVHAEAARLKLAQRAKWPTLNLAPGLDALWVSAAGLSGTTTALRLGAGLVVPVFSQSRLAAAADAQGARKEGAVSEYDQVVSKAVAEARSSLRRAAEDADRLPLLARVEEARRTTREAEEVRVRAGVSAPPKRLEARRDWLSADAARRQGFVAANRNAVSVFLALGGDWRNTPDSQPTND